MIHQWTRIETSNFDSVHLDVMDFELDHSMAGIHGEGDDDDLKS